MAIFDKIKDLKTAISKDYKEFKDRSNVIVVLINDKRNKTASIRDDTGIVYTFHHSVRMKVGDIFVDERNRVRVVEDISNELEKTFGLTTVKYFNATTKEYENKAGVLYLYSNQSTNAKQQINISAGNNVTIDNSVISTENLIVLSIFNNIDIKSVWKATKSDLYNLYDYEKYENIVTFVDESIDSEGPLDEKNKEKANKLLKVAKDIASVLGVFVGEILLKLIEKK